MKNIFIDRERKKDNEKRTLRKLVLKREKPVEMYHDGFNEKRTATRVGRFCIGEREKRKLSFCSLFLFYRD